MSVSIDKLIRMAEQISANISIDEDSRHKGEKLAMHMKKFWDPRIRQSFLEYARSEQGASALSPVLAAAAEHLQAENAGA